MFFFWNIRAIIMVFLEIFFEELNTWAFEKYFMMGFKSYVNEILKNVYCRTIKPENVDF